ncbi:uncharacterized protein KY384_004333 [Bacidia gigantensis]|uniref:uncharacterized protein n=1 Tax=Bacidia gigantensis TaxID=2732470 RepID=UPI001D046AC1|nr:uncharacterized protein KY384_004333 [Bacidia gigantensis]KAG8530976.1 hypothetical protein KY384_004333 [Bacidia gigantensis]
MLHNQRTLRSTPKGEPELSSKTVFASPISFENTSTSLSQVEALEYIPLGDILHSVDASENNILRRKQRKLAATTASTYSLYSANPMHLNALNSTLIFAQHEAGTAVCIHPDGWLLTCSHCIGESPIEWQANKRKWLLYYTGLAVQAECRAWDPIRDLALLKIVIIEITQPGPQHIPVFAHLPLAFAVPKIRTPIFCLGQPGAEDLESDTYRKTKYNLTELSEGKYYGIVGGADPQNNEAIGTLKHDAWTYWGHSGAPLVSAQNGELIGLHSSWDELTGMRHGIPLEALGAFVSKYLGSEGDIRGGMNVADKGKQKEVIDLTAESD